MKCYLCETTSFIERKGKVRDAPLMKILECSSCGLVTLEKRDHINSEFYKNSGMHGQNPDTLEFWLKETDWDDQRRFLMFKEKIVNKRILDFGCGAAGFLNKINKISSYAAGIEVEDRVRKFWKDKMDLFPSIEDCITKENRKFDLITSFHVFEHLIDPRRVLTSFSNILDSKGNVIIEVPNASDALLTLYDCQDFQKFNYWSQHLFVFNELNLKTLAEQSGFNILSIQYYQRYPLSNHLYWLSKGLPGGHNQWSFLDNPILQNAYAASLSSLGKTDTLIAYLEKKN